MFERDYLMRQILLLFQAIAKSWQQKEEEEDPLAAADTLEEAISQATELDGAAMLSLSPESIAQVLQVSGVDPKVVSYIGHSMLLESQYLAQGGQFELAATRKAQAMALASAYGFDLPEDFSDWESLDPQAQAASGGDRAAYGDDGVLDEFGAQPAVSEDFDEPASAQANLQSFDFSQLQSLDDLKNL